MYHLCVLTPDKIIHIELIAKPYISFFVQNKGFVLMDSVPILKQCINEGALDWLVKMQLNGNIQLLSCEDFIDRIVDLFSLQLGYLMTENIYYPSDMKPNQS